MLGQSRAFSSFSVDDLAKAKNFYGQTLGLDVKESPQGLELRIIGGFTVFIYPKPDHKPASFTVLNFPVRNIDEVVDKLTKAGVRFEQYDMGEIKTDAKGVARTTSPEEGPSIAWFKDPAGNVLAVLEAEDGS